MQVPFRKLGKYVARLLDSGIEIVVKRPFRNSERKERRGSRETALYTDCRSIASVRSRLQMNLFLLRIPQGPVVEGEALYKRFFASNKPHLLVLAPLSPPQ